MTYLLENNHTEIFTDFDDSIFSDDSIDPLGLQMVWTSIGNKIFHNRLNTVSTNIRYYTLNLFHHLVIRQVEERYEDKIVNLTGQPPYDNRADLYDGMVIFLECLLVHILSSEGVDESVKKELFIPGIAALQRIRFRNASDKIVTSIPVDKKDGILVRHILLGVHGRHKGPFQQMGIFEKQHYYADKRLWTEIRRLFSSASWTGLLDALVQSIDRHILSQKVVGQKPIRVKVHEVIHDRLIEHYLEGLQPRNFVNKEIVRFWEYRLGVADQDTTAGLLYRHIAAANGDIDFDETLRSLHQSHPTDELRAINAIEPFVTSLQKIMNRLLARGTTELDDTVVACIAFHLDQPMFDIEAIESYLSEAYFNPESIRRLHELIHIYLSSDKGKNRHKLMHDLIEYHKTLMKQRHNLPWIDTGRNKSIRQHRSFVYSDADYDALYSHRWVNNYYLSTLVSLYKGLHP